MMTVDGMCLDIELTAFLQPAMCWVSFPNLENKKRALFYGELESI